MLDPVRPGFGIFTWMNASKKTALAEADAVFSCVWTEHGLVIPEADPIIIAGDPHKILPALKAVGKDVDTLVIHYQGADLLIIPPLQTGQSLTTALAGRLPRNLGLTDYLLAKPSADDFHCQAFLPLTTVSEIFASAQKAGFHEVRIVAMPVLAKKNATLLLANGTWLFRTDKSGASHLTPLPKEIHGVAPDWLKPSSPLLDFRYQPFTKPCFVWTDAATSAQKTKVANQRLLIRLAAGIALTLLVVWLGLGWSIRGLEDQLVHQHLDKKQSLQFRQAYQTRLDHLKSLQSRLQHHPAMVASQSQAIQFRKVFNACPSGMILNSVISEVDHGRPRLWITGFCEGTQTPLDFIEALKNDQHGASANLVSLRPTSEKDAKQDPRLNNTQSWYTFSVRLDSP